MSPLPTASRLDQAVTCPASCVLPHVNTQREDGRRGHSVHEFLASMAPKDAGGLGLGLDDAIARIDDPDHRLLCASLDIAGLPINLAHEVAFAINVRTGEARELGRGIGRDYRAAGATEEDICGTVDVLGVSEDAVFVGDYKSGWLDPAAAKTARQLRFGALAAARVYDKSFATVEMIRVRENRKPWHDRAELDLFDLDGFFLELQDLARKIAGLESWLHAAKVVPNVTEGEHCRFCPAWSACPAKGALIKRMALGSEFEELENLKPMTPATAGLAYVRVKEARSMLAKIEAAIMATQAEYGHLELPSGKHLRKVLEPGNLKIDGRVAYQVIQELHDQEIAESAVKIVASQSGIEDALAEAAKAGKIPPRGRAKAMRAILAETEKRGGTSNPMTERQVEVDPQLTAGEGSEAA